MIVSWYLPDTDCYFFEKVHDAFDTSLYHFVLLEEVLYNCIYHNKIAFAVPTLTEEHPSSLYQQFCNENYLFPYTFVIYTKLRNAGWTVKDGAEYGCNYILYPQSTDASHSLLLASIDFQKGIVKQESITQQTLQQWNFQEVDTIPTRIHPTDQPKPWSVIQRMTRLAASQHKVWSSLSLEPPFHYDTTLEELLCTIEGYTLHILTFEHWNPKLPDHTHLHVVTKYDFCFNKQYLH